MHINLEKQGKVRILKRKNGVGFSLFNVPEEVKEREGMENGLDAKIAEEEVPSMVAICN